MTDRELFEKVLEAMEHLHRTGDTQVFDLCYAPELIPALRERLAQPEQSRAEKMRDAGYTRRPTLREIASEAEQPEQEPVAWISEGGDVSRSKRYMDEMGFECNPLYTAPPQRKPWVGLTADEIWKCNAAPKGSAVEYHICMAHQNVLDFAEALEAKLKEKNNG